MNRLALAAAALLVIQVVHGAIPAETTSEGYVGAVVGAALILSSIVGIVGARTNKPWAPNLIGLTGLTVALGFLSYHVTPWHSPMTNPYIGEDKIGLAQWTPVFLCIAVGLWAAWEAAQYRRAEPSIA